MPPHLQQDLGVLYFVIGWTPAQCLVWFAVIAFCVQFVNAFSTEPEDDEVDLEHYRPSVFWRALYRFASSVQPFHRGRRLDSPPTSSLTEYERVTLRYMLVKLIFAPMMISSFFGMVQQLLGPGCRLRPPFHATSPYDVQLL